MGARKNRSDGGRFLIKQYVCRLCGRKFPHEDGREPRCPTCGERNKCYVEAWYDASEKGEKESS